MATGKTPEGVTYERQEFTPDVIRQLRLRHKPNAKGSFASPDSFNIYCLLDELEDAQKQKAAPAKPKIDGAGK